MQKPFCMPARKKACSCSPAALGQYDPLDPPLVVTEAQIDDAMDIFAAALEYGGRKSIDKGDG